VDFFIDDDWKYFVGIDDRAYENDNYTRKIIFLQNYLNNK